jgi:hypothetical protein
VKKLQERKVGNVYRQFLKKISSKGRKLDRRMREEVGAVLKDPVIIRHIE